MGSNPVARTINRASALAGALFLFRNYENPRPLLSHQTGRQRPHAKRRGRGSNPVARTINEVSALADASFLFYAMRTHGLFYWIYGHKPYAQRSGFGFESRPFILYPRPRLTKNSDFHVKMPPIGWHFYSEYKYVLFQFQKSVFCRRPIEAALNTGFCPALRWEL